MELLLAVILGAAFGFVLHRIGASNPHNIINMLRLTDLHLMKAILFGISISSAFLFIGFSVGIIEPSHLDVKTAYWGVLLGGIFMGIAWPFTGYCPSTSMAALGDGRKDAVFFVLGGLVGAYLYMLAYAHLEGTFLLKKLLGGNVTLALTPNESYPALINGIPGVIPALVVAVVLGLIAWKLPGKRI
ncbi:MAG: YeeE/YedE thiosulfate transporter family protein [Syntrophales bacterium]|nr:YeeE/YedE thiosulfate transporter family protein [Syntrophales bacterium]